MLKIGEFSKLSRISVRMLRHYDEIGLLRPTELDRFTGYRYYHESQLSAAGRIVALRDMGFGLSAIGEILSCWEDRSRLEQHLLAHQAELRLLSEQIVYRMRLLDTALNGLRKEEHTMTYDVTLKTFPECRAATVRRVLPSYEMEGMLWNTLMQETESLRVVPDDPCYCRTVFLDQEYKEKDVEVEVQKTVKGTYPDTEHVRFKLLPEVTVASAICKGSYRQMGDVMAAVTQWVIANGYAFDGPAFNIYHISPYETQNPEEFVTEVCYPVKKQ